MKTRMIRKSTALTMVLLMVTATCWVLPEATEARQVRNTTRGSVNRDMNRNRDFNRNRNVNRDMNRNRNVNVNRNRNVNVNRNINVHRDIDVDVDRHYGGYYGGHPIATAAAVTAAATVTAAVVGSMVSSLPPSCSAVMVNGFTYQNCSGTWYQPQYAGSQVTYVVVNPPQ